MSPQPTTRAKRFLIASALSIGLVVALSVGTVLLYVATAIAHSGSTGRELQAFWDRLVPAGHFLLGAAAGTCITGLINSIAAKEGVWWAGIIVAALVFGSFAVFNPPFASALSRAAEPALGLAAKLLLTK